VNNTPLLCTIVRTTEGTSEPRFRRILEVLIELGFQTSQITWNRRSDKGDSSQPDQLDLKTPFGRGLTNVFRHLHFQIHIWRRLNSRQPQIVYSCDLDTYLVCFVWAKLHRRKLIFDQFDPISSRFNGFFTKTLNVWENFLTSFADKRITANIERVTKRNQWIELPNFYQLKIARKDEFSETATALYGGVLQPDRGILRICHFFSSRSNWFFDIYGFGTEFSAISAYSDSYPNISAHPVTEHRDLMDIASRCWLIIAPYDPSKHHNRLTASNKLYEATQLGIPLATTSGTQIGELVQKYRLGWCFEFNSLDGLERAVVERSQWNEQDLIDFRLRCDIFLAEIAGQRNLSIYQTTMQAFLEVNK
jgi:hypothetical protein